MMMEPHQEKPSFAQLVTTADCLLDECGEDEEALVRRLEVLPVEVRNELFVSDLLNAWQVFYYYFRTVPDELRRERMELEPASSLVSGVFIDEVELLEIIFAIKNHMPHIYITDGEKVLSTFSGPSAYEDGLRYIESTL